MVPSNLCHCVHTFHRAACPDPNPDPNAPLTSSAARPSPHPTPCDRVPASIGCCVASRPPYSLSPLVKKIKENQVEKLVTMLGEKCLKESKKEKRDIASTAMKTMVAEIPGDFSNAVRKLTTPLVHGIDVSPSPSTLQCNWRSLIKILHRVESFVYEHQSKSLRQPGFRWPCVLPLLVFPLHKDTRICFEAMCRCLLAKSL